MAEPIDWLTLIAQGEKLDVEFKSDRKRLSDSELAETVDQGRLRLVGKGRVAHYVPSETREISE